MTSRPRLVHLVTVPMSFWLVRGQAGVMASAGFDVHAISSPGDGAEAYSRNESVPIHRVAIARRISPWRDLVSLLQLSWTLLRLHPQVVHAGTPKAGLLGTIAAFLLRVRTRVYYVHGLPLVTARGIRRVILRASERLACAAATHVICVSPSVRAELVEGGLCPAGKAIVLGRGSCNGVDTDWFDRTRLPQDTRRDVRARLGIPDDALVVGFIGRIGREKGIGELHEAWRLLREQFPAAHLLIIGPPETTDPPPAEALRDFAMDPRVHLPGEDWNTAPLYAAMDVCCLPSHREGMPNVPLEAAAMELPVVAFGVCGVVDAVEDGVTGRLVAPFCARSLAAALAEYLSDSALRARHGEAGRIRILRYFSQKKVWAELTSFYKSVARQYTTEPVERQIAGNRQCTEHI